MIPYEWIEDAAARIAPHIDVTPLTYDPTHDIYLKWENHQVTGSFKSRGAFNKVLTLLPWERERGIIAASAGNHGQGLALACKLVDAPVTIFASEGAVPSKIEAMRSLGAEIRLVPGGYGDAETAGIDYASRCGATWVSPYNDGQIIAGQGTIVPEILAEFPDLKEAAWIVPASGGGLLAGVACALKGSEFNNSGSQEPLKVIAVQSEASAFLYHIYHYGSQKGVRELSSLADGLAGPVEIDSITLPIVKRHVDDFVLVNENEIARTIAYAWEHYQERIEGSGAASLAAILTGKISHRPAVVIITGGNIHPDVFYSIRDQYGVQ